MDGIWNKLKESKTLTLLLIIGAVYFFLRYLTPLFSPILLAMLFVTIFGPMLQRMQEAFRLNRQVSAVILLLFAGTVIALLVWILFSWIVGSLPLWVSKLDVLEEQLGVIVSRGCETVGRTIGIDSAYLQKTILGRIEESIDYFQMQAVPGMLSQSLQYVKLVAAFGGFLVSFLIAAVLLAKDYDNIMNKLLDREECHVLLEVICGIIRYIATFVKAQIIIMSIIAVLSAVVLFLTRVGNGPLWGILAGILDALPFIGTGIVLIPLALSQLFYGYYGKAAVIVLLYCACAFTREMLEPRLIGSRIGVPPIAVLISVYAGIRLFGIWGIIKGPLGFVIIYQTYRSLQKRSGVPVDGDGPVALS